jgi:hypothetical protein
MAFQLWLQFVQLSSMRHGNWSSRNRTKYPQGTKYMIASIPHKEGTAELSEVGYEASWSEEFTLALFRTQN